MKADYTIKARETFVCPLCNWRVTDGKETRARTEIRWHLRHEHGVRGNRVKIKAA